VSALAAPRPVVAAATVPVDADPLVSEALAAGPGVSLVRVPPTDDQYRVVATAAAHGSGNVLVVAPGVAWARWLAGRLGRDGFRTHLQPGAWSGGTAGGVVVGPRSAVWAPTAPLDAVVVLDEHDEGLQEERNPTWHARDVAIERARRAGVPCLLVSPGPSLQAAVRADRTVAVGRSRERAGWPRVQVIDRRDDEPGRGGLFSDAVAAVFRERERAVAVLNRKGRAAMLACASCGELVRTEDGTELMVELEGRLVAPRAGEERPLVCAVCTGTTLKRLRLGVTRAAEELGALVGRPVTEWTADSDHHPDGDGLILGTEAVLHARIRTEAVVFLDFDQELLAPRYRSAEQAMSLLVRAARLVGDRSGSGPSGGAERGSGSGSRAPGVVVVQTSVPDHRVLRAATAADPLRLLDDEEPIRRALGFPPFGAVAEVAGPGAAAMLKPLLDRDPDPAPDRAGAGAGDGDESPPSSVTVLGPRPDGQYLVVAPDDEHLADVLAGLDRPRERVRVAVDPPRV
jgi:primosomal protein N' (replication factor Y)